MPSRHRAPLEVTWDQVAAFRMSRHHLTERASASGLASVARDMAGVHAQLLSAAQVSLWARVRELQIGQVERALAERTLVKASCMRRTLFLVPSASLAVFVRGSARRAEKEIRWVRRKGVPDRVLDAAIDAVLRELEQPRTRSEIADCVSRALGRRMSAIPGGGWGSGKEVMAVPVGGLTLPIVYLLLLASARGVICSGPNRGREPTHVRADAWIPQWRDLPPAEAERSLLDMYLRAYGPAAVTDFAFWTGMTLTEAREIWAHEQVALTRVRVEGWDAAILQEDLEALVQAELKHPVVRLLPYFDTYLLGHKQREHLVAARDKPKVYRAQGWIAPVVLANGRAVAVWEHTQEGNRLHVRVTGFGHALRRMTAAIREEAQRLGQFLGVPDVDVQIA